MSIFRQYAELAVTGMSNKVHTVNAESSAPRNYLHSELISLFERLTLFAQRSSLPFDELFGTQLIKGLAKTQDAMLCLGGANL